MQDFYLQIFLHCGIAIFTYIKDLSTSSNTS